MPDVSMSGSCSGAVDCVRELPGRSGFPRSTGGWGPICGTSEASPLFSGEVALADQAAGHPLGTDQPDAVRDGRRPPLRLTDITIGNNTVTFTHSNGQTYTVKGYNAQPGYDLASGLGEANIAFPLELAALSSHRGR